MHNLKIFNLLLFIFTYIAKDKVTSDEDYCIAWDIFDKCIELEGKSEVQCQTGKERCESRLHSSLVTVRTENDQQFLEKFIKSKNIVTNIWIGLQFKDGKYLWPDELEPMYTNWLEHLNNSTDAHCVELIVESENFGKWAKVNCDKNNLVVCEILLWPMPELQGFILQLKNKVKKEREHNKQLETAIEDLSIQDEKRLEQYKQLQQAIQKFTTSQSEQKDQFQIEITKIIPIGFVYVQISYKDPKAAAQYLWPQMKWREITGDYQDIFFRFEGNGSSAFGTKQSSNFPTLIVRAEKDKFSKRNVDVTIPENGDWSSSTLTGSSLGIVSDDKWAMFYRWHAPKPFYYPKHQFVRYWKRVG